MSSPVGVGPLPPVLLLLSVESLVTSADSVCVPCIMSLFSVVDNML